MRKSKTTLLLYMTWILLILLNLVSCQSNPDSTQTPSSEAPTLTSTFTLQTITPIPALKTRTSEPLPTMTTAPSPSPSPTPIIPTNIPAFPGAEGFGSNTLGGRGGRVIEVTNLNDSGPGSLREAINADGPRMVVFKVSGTIGLNSLLEIRNPFITIAGQSAPGGGITLRGLTVKEDLFTIYTHDVVIRYLTLRAGPPAIGDAMSIYATDHQAYNIVIDHVSMSWGVDEVFSTWYDVHDISIQWNIFSEGLNCSVHPKGCHSKGPFLGSYASDEKKTSTGASNFSFHHNLISQNVERTPLVKTSGVCDVVNNVVYNPMNSFSHFDMENQMTTIPVNYVGNYFKRGPNTDPNKFGIQGTNLGPLGAQVYLEGNIGPTRLDNSLPQINILDPKYRNFVVTTRHPAEPITTTSAEEAYKKVLADAGANAGLSCTGKWVTRQDAIDARIVKDITQGTGKIINSPTEVGGYLAIAAASPCDDLDHDGMPDQWETMYGLNPNDPTDSSKDNNWNGYTNIEEFLNGRDPLK